MAPVILKLAALILYIMCHFSLCGKLEYSVFLATNIGLLCIIVRTFLVGKRGYKVYDKKYGKDNMTINQYLITLYTYMFSAMMTNIIRCHYYLIMALTLAYVGKQDSGNLIPLAYAQ